MDAVVAGVLISAAILLLMLLGMPIFLSLGVVGLAVMFLLGPLQFDMAAQQMFQSLQGFEVLAIPLFVMMSAFFARSNVGKDLYEFAYRWLSKIPGSLAVANIFACGIFSALSGSSPATAAAIGGIGIPEMRKRGYPGAFSAAVIVAGGTLGILIPPSITMILYGVAVQASIGKLFLAGVLPGILIIILFSVWVSIYWLISKKKLQAAVGVEAGVADAAEDITVHFSWKERLESLFRAWPSLLMIVVIIGAMYTGVASPSEIAAIGLVLTVIIVLLWDRQFNKRFFSSIFINSAHESSMILMIIAGAVLITYPISFLRIPQMLAETLIGLEVSRWLIFILICLLLFVLGMFLPPAAIIVMVAPILDPVIKGLGFDPIWFGVILTIIMEIGLITPPVGLNLFVVQPLVPDVSFKELIIATIPFILLMILAIVLLCFFPQIALWLPSKM